MDEIGECGSDGNDMDGNDEVSEDVIESHLSCFDSGSDAGCEGDFSFEGGVDVDVDAPGRTA